MLIMNRQLGLSGMPDFGQASIKNALFRAVRAEFCGEPARAVFLRLAQKLLVDLQHTMSIDIDWSAIS